jgi:hypothetical protein
VRLLAEIKFDHELRETHESVVTQFDHARNETQAHGVTKFDQSGNETQKNFVKEKIMNTATKKANNDPSIYILPFREYALANDLEFNVDNIAAWDAEHNHGQMRAAFIAKYGEKVIFEMAIRELFRQYLYRGHTIYIVPNEKNPEGLKKGTKVFSGIQQGRYVPQMTATQLDNLVAIQTQKVKDAKVRLLAYGLPLARVRTIFTQILDE